MTNEELVQAAEINQTVELPDGYFDSVKFDNTNYGDGYRFSWSAHIRGRGRNDYSEYAYPRGSSTSIIGVFKTLAGAKKNFLKRMKS